MVEAANIDPNMVMRCLSERTDRIKTIVDYRQMGELRRVAKQPEPPTLLITWSSATCRIERGITVPVGMCCATLTRVPTVPFPSPEERIPEISFATTEPFFQLAQAKIEAWHRSGELPYATEPLAPLSEAWWDQARKLMAFRVQIGAVQTIDCTRPEDEIETLFEASCIHRFRQVIAQRMMDIEAGIRQVVGTFPV